VFFQGFPEFADNDFFITGESYAGIYVPTLAYAIYEATAAGTTSINLKGIAVGNGCSGNEVGVCSNQRPALVLPYYGNHALFSATVYNQLVTACDNFKKLNAPACIAAQNLAAKEIGNVNIYDIYAPCINGNEILNSTKYLRTGAPKEVGGPSECIDSIAASAYLNQPNVMAALHVNPAPSGSWSVCGNVIDYTSTVANEPRDYYPTLIANYRVWIYNGDVDGCVPYNDNEAWTSGMGYNVKTAWRPWTVQQQVAGYVTVYENNDFSFITVKGAGHMVPQYKPAEALVFFQSFIAGTPLP